MFKFLLFDLTTLFHKPKGADMATPADLQALADKIGADANTLKAAAASNAAALMAANAQIVDLTAKLAAAGTITEAQLDPVAASLTAADATLTSP